MSRLRVRECLITLGWIGALGLFALLTDRLLPPDMARYERLSVEVLDRDGMPRRLGRDARAGKDRAVLGGNRSSENETAEGEGRGRSSHGENRSGVGPAPTAE